MTADPKRAITPQLRLQTFALCLLGNTYSRKADECNSAVMEMLGVEDGGHLSDIIFARADLTVEEFDEKLGYAGFVVEPDAATDQAKTMIAALERADEAATDPIFSDSASVIRQLVERVERLTARRASGEHTP